MLTAHVRKKPLSSRPKCICTYLCVLMLLASAEVTAAATKLIPTGIQAAGDGKTVFLCLPVLAKGNSPEFIIWYHPANRRLGNGGLWKSLNSTALIGHPACITTMRLGRANSGSSTLVTFFRGGTGWQYSRAGRVALPPLPQNFAPKSACDCANGLAVLGTELQTLPAAPAAAAPRAKQRLTVHAANTRSTLSAATAKMKAVSHAQMTRGKPLVGHTAVRWQLLQLRHGHWRVMPLPVGFVHSVTHGNPVLVDHDGSMWLFVNRSGQQESIDFWRARWQTLADSPQRALATPAKQIARTGAEHAIQKATTRPAVQTAKVSGIPSIKWDRTTRRLEFSTPNAASMELATSRGIAILVAFKTAHASMQVRGGILQARDGRNFFKAWNRTSTLHQLPANIPLTDVAAAQDGDGINLLLLGLKGTVSSITLSTTGQQIYGLSDVTVQKTQPEQSPSYPQFLVLAMVTLLVFSLWQRKAPVNTSEKATFAIAMLRYRIPAALIDMVLAAGVVALVFKLYDYHAWQPIIHAAENILAQPDLILSTPPLLMWICLYELHVIVGEALVGRSIGKAIMGIQVVDITGKPATPLAILIRNLIRIPEMITVFLLIFMFVSEERQRLGDLIARTIVVKRKK